MLTEAIGKKASTVRVRTLRSLLGQFFGHDRRRQAVSILIYTSLMTPAVYLLRILCPKAKVYYMVRGDEISYVLFARRRVRAAVAWVFQKTMRWANVEYVFASEDLAVLFEKRYGRIRKKSVLPNTAGVRLPPTATFDGRVALVGDFGTVKNMEWALENLTGGKYEVHIYGNRRVPRQWDKPWVHCHGVVDDLTGALRRRPMLVLLPDISAGFPNVVNEALLAGCPVAAHDAFPFKYFPLHEAWRFSLSSPQQECGSESPLERSLARLMKERRDFQEDNIDLVELVESSWEERVWEIFG